MSSLKYFVQEGTNTLLSNAYHYSQAVVVGNIVKLSGQGGWIPNAQNQVTDDDVAEDYDRQVELTFDNIDSQLRQAGSSLEDVYLVRAFVVDISGEKSAGVVKVLQKRFLNHRPLFTLIGISALAVPRMQIEIEVEAYLK